MKKDKIIKYCIFILFLFLPIRDILRTTFIKDVEIFNISVIEIVNIVLITVALLFTIIKIFRKQKREVFLLFIFLALSLVYIFLHYKNIIRFDTSIYEKANFNFMIESFYIFRIYVLPLLVVFILLTNKDIFNREFYFNVAKIVICEISFSIIVLNILKISYISYSASHKFITNNMFDYFLYTGNYRQLASRGWFDSANELSAILIMLLPINIYLYYKENKKFNLVMLFCQILSMIILGTRIAALGSVLVSFFSLLVYIIVQYINKKKLNYNFLKSTFIISIILTAFMTISPFMFGKIENDFHVFSNSNATLFEEIDKEKENKTIADFIYKNRYKFAINEAFLKLYPPKNDIDFWKMIIKRDPAINNNSRVIKIDIISRIKERNNNKMDSLFGLGYTLNFLDLERDYVNQYYIFGIFGIILFIVPYLITLFVNIFKLLFGFKKYFNFGNVLFIMSGCLGLLSAYLSGHVFGWVSPMMCLAMCLCLSSCFITNKKEKEGQK